mmetsp:Transcript_67096/g.151699  ORF Transcript_67096/g.151699 Transcript_67096/m.151699 type:complete len:1062 (-) Transcript_67096:293-3478(-)
MAQKRREEWQREARGGSKNGKKIKPRHKSPLEVFYTEVLGWRADRLEAGPELEPLPVSFKNARDYFSRFKAPLFAEARALLTGGTSGCDSISLVPAAGDAQASRFGRLLLLDSVRPLRPEQFDLMRPGQVFSLRAPGDHCRPVLAAWAQIFLREYSEAQFVLIVTDDAFPQSFSRLEARPLASLLSLQRMYEACERMPQPPFFAQMLLAKQASHTRFDSSSSEEDDPTLESADEEPVGRAEAASPITCRAGQLAGPDPVEETFQGDFEAEGACGGAIISEDGHGDGLTHESSHESSHENAGTALEESARAAAERLNPSQRAALEDFTALGSAGDSGKLSLVQGPPGSGKTSLLVATLLRLVAAAGGGRVLVCASSNKATCLLLDRFLAALPREGRESSGCGGGGGGAGFVSLIGVADKVDEVGDAGKGVLCWRQAALVAERARADFAKARDLETTLEIARSLATRTREAFPRYFKRHACQPFEEALAGLAGLLPAQSPGSPGSPGRAGSGRTAPGLPGKRARPPLAKAWDGGFCSALVASLQALGCDPEAMAAAASDALGGATLIFSTIGSAGQSALRNAVGHRGGSWAPQAGDEEEGAGGGGFEAVVVDEAGQALEAEVLVPLSLGCKKLLLVGDPMQLPATLMSQRAERCGFGRSLLSRLMGCPAAGGNVSSRRGLLEAHLLETQYRMHPAISAWPSERFYASRLGNGPGTGGCQGWRAAPKAAAAGSTGRAAARGRLLRAHFFGGPLRWVSSVSEGQTGGGGEQVDARSRSLMNAGEARLAVEVVRKLVDEVGAVEPKDVVIIATYSAQVALLRRLLGQRPSKGRAASSQSGASQASQRVAVHTVDSFQGSEAKVVVLSLVRSNAQARHGFLADGRRLNVATSRAQDLLLILGDARTLGQGSGAAASLHASLAARGLVVDQGEFRQGLAREWGEPSGERLDREVAAWAKKVASGKATSAGTREVARTEESAPVPPRPLPIEAGLGDQVERKRRQGPKGGSQKAKVSAGGDEPRTWEEEECWEEGHWEDECLESNPGPEEPRALNYQVMDEQDHRLGLW